jgi:hypothetical protein
MQRHDQLKLNPVIRDLLFSLSASTMDRMLGPLREPACSRRKRKAKNKSKKKVPVKMFSDWVDPKIGHMEMDFVVHCGGNMSGILFTLL